MTTTAERQSRVFTPGTANPRPFWSIVDDRYRAVPTNPWSIYSTADNGHLEVTLRPSASNDDEVELCGIALIQRVRLLDRSTADDTKRYMPLVSLYCRHGIRPRLISSFSRRHAQKSGGESHRHYRLYSRGYTVTNKRPLQTCMQPSMDLPGVLGADSELDPTTVRLSLRSVRDSLPVSKYVC